MAILIIFDFGSFIISHLIDVKYTSVLDKNIDETVEVGVFGDDGEELIQKAVINEFGLYPLIPSRPFIRYTMDMYEEKIGKFIEKEVGRMLDKNLKVDYVLGRVGEFVKALIVKSINTSKSWAEPNAPSTISKKGSDHPLVASGELRAKITYRMNV